jgi:hypothetical protein
LGAVAEGTASGSITRPKFLAAEPVFSAAIVAITAEIGQG